MKRIFILFACICTFSFSYSQFQYLGNFTSDGTPLYFVTSDVVSQATLNLVKNALPEQYPVPTYNPQYISSGYDTDIILEDSADVWVTFLDEGAGYKNVLGFYTYNINSPLTSTPPNSAITIIFPNVSKAGSGGSLVAGNKVKIGTFSANTGIGFVLLADGFKNGVVTNGNWKLFSNPNFNPESNASLRYHNVLIADSTNNRIILGFEDIRRDYASCDNDFNDALFYITSNPYTAIKTSNFATIESANQTVSSGNLGGLESNGRLAGKIAKRMFTRGKNNTDKFSRKEYQTSFLELANRQGGFNKTNNLLPNYIPATGMYGTETALVSTPGDLLQITNATEVFSNDYYINNDRIAVALATHTNDRVYDHTKNICDRLNGASLEDVRTIELNNYKLVNTTFRKVNGEIEYTITFSVKVQSNENSLFSYWNIEQYPAGEYLNFQVWGSTMGQVCSIAKDILQKLETEKPLLNNSTLTNIPDVFIKKGTYKNGKLLLTIRNKKRINEILFDGNSRQTETVNLNNVTRTIPLTTALEQDVEITTGSIFDIGFSITYPGNTQMDALYLADGAWGTDYDNQMVNDVKFSVANNNSTSINSSSLLIERSPEVKCKVKGTVNLFRNAKSGNVPLDISEYSNISFDIQSNKAVEIVLVADNLNSWEERARYNITPTPQAKTITIPISKFSNNGQPVSLTKIKTIVYSITGDYKNFAEANLKIGNVNFNKDVVTKQSEYTTVGAYPNPFPRYTTLTFPAQYKSGMLQITDAVGRVVMNEEINIYNGEYNLDAIKLNKGLYFFTLNTKEGAKTSGKLMKN